MNNHNNKEIEHPHHPVPRVYGWFSKRGVHSAFVVEPDETMSRVEFGSLTPDEPELIVRSSRNGSNFNIRPATYEEGRKFLEMVQTDIPDASILEDLRMAVSRLEVQGNNPAASK